MAEFFTMTTAPSPPSGKWECDEDNDNDNEITSRMNRGPSRIKPLNMGGGVGSDLVSAA